VGQNFVWVGQARVWVGHCLPGLIARTASVAEGLRNSGRANKTVRLTSSLSVGTDSYTKSYRPGLPDVTGSD